MKTDLKDYIKVYNSIDKELCTQLLEELKLAEWNKHTFYYPSVDISKEISEHEPQVTYTNIPLKEKLMDIVFETLKQYVIEDCNLPWYTGWNGFTNIRFHQYDQNTEMHEHCDHIHSMFEGERRGIPVISIVGVLNDNFEGGEFVLCEDLVYNLRAGDIILFPSVFLYPHRVNRIVNGTRHSFVSWVY